LRAWGR